MVWIGKERVFHQRMRVLSALLPLLKRFIPELNRLATGQPIKVVIKLELAVLPITLKKIALFPIHDVVLKGEAPVRFLAGAPDLRLLSKSKNVVPNHVFASIVLVKATILSVVDDIVLNPDLAAPFVRVDTPAAIGVARNIVAEIVPLHRSGLNAQRVDAAHVAQQAAANVIKIIEFDMVVGGGR